jgi:hypothetical protein
MNILSVARQTWMSGAAFRAARERSKRYTYGDQWGDTVRDALGRLTTEAQAIEQSGRKPLTNNLIRRLVKTVIGRYRTVAAQSGRYSKDPDSVDVANALSELDSRLLEEFLISGCAIQRVTRETRRSKTAVWIDNVSPNTFFANDFRDPRGFDVNLVGQLHDMSAGEMRSRFGVAFNAESNMQPRTAIFDPDASTTDFFRPRPGYFRAIEVWTYEPSSSTICHDPRTASVGTVTADIASSLASDTSLTIVDRMDFKWHCRWYDSCGKLLDHYLSPYAHGGHPFVFKFYPLLDGEIHSFVEDLIDQQRYINRLIVLLDKMLGSAAKGVLLFPQTQKPKNMTWQDVADRWSATDGVIPIVGTSQILPQQISSPASDAGAHRLLELEMKLFEDVSGVSDVLLGTNTPANIGADLYQARLQASSTSLADILDTFASLTASRDALASTL